MGEVYRARDTKLNREVAIKVLPQHMASDADALARFEREAHSVAALNHPNILSIHDFASEAGVAYAVTELLEGETLRELVAGKPLPIRKAIDYSRQICAGLAAAHARGIVHRDLKPDNVFVTNDGRVKILDFGLARPAPGGGSLAPDQTHSPTVSAFTEPGTVMGTVGYMSPEQVKGIAVDHRSDLFSFGAVLYEMLTGKRAFQRDTAAETMTAVLREEPPDLDASGVRDSPVLDRIVRHCLEKKPEQRFQSATDIAFDLETFSVATGTASGRSAIAAGAPPAGRNLGIAAAIVAAAAAVLATGVFLDRAVRPAPVSPSFERLTFRRGTVGAARFAPDGRTVVYSAQWEGAPTEIYSVSSGAEESRAVGVADAMLLSVSSTGELAVKLRPTLWSGHFQGTLARVPLSGGSPRELREAVQDADWAPDGRSLALVRILSSASWSFEYPEGKTLAEEHITVNGFRLSPDGSRIAISEGFLPWWTPKLVLLDRSGGRKTLADDQVSGLAWRRSGEEVWFTSPEPGGATNLRAVRPSGKSRLVYRSAGTLTLQDISAGGDLLVSLLSTQSSVICRAPGAAAETNLAWHDGSEVADISPDGRTVLIQDAQTGNRRTGAFYIRKTDGSPAIRLGEGTAQSFSPDGKWVLAQALNSRRTLVMVPTGAGEPKSISVPFDLSQWWFFPDGRRILVAGISPEGQTRIYSVDLDGKSYRQIAPDGVDTFLGEMPISPDGKLIAAQGGPSNAVKVQLFPAEGGPPRTVPGLESDDIVIRWAGDGRSLFVFKRNRLPARVFKLDVETGRRTPWLDLAPPDPAGVMRIPIIVMTPDGRSYAYNFTRELSDLYRIRGLR
jgi:WD40 repeat protein